MKFIRQDIHKKKRLDPKWRKPRGRQSKLRLRRQGKYLVGPGHKSPQSTRGLHTSGKTIVHVTAPSDLTNLDAKKHIVIVSGKLGNKKRIPLLQSLMEKKIEILNISNPAEYIKKAQESRNKVQVEKETKTKEKKSSSKKESIEDVLSGDEKKKVEKKEIDRLLTKKF